MTSSQRRDKFTFRDGKVNLSVTSRIKDGYTSGRGTTELLEFNEKNVK